MAVESTQKEHIHSIVDEAQAKIRQAGTGTVRHVIRENKNGRLFGCVLSGASLCLFGQRLWCLCGVQLADSRDQIESARADGLHGMAKTAWHTNALNCYSTNLAQQAYFPFQCILFVLFGKLDVDDVEHQQAVQTSMCLPCFNTHFLKGTNDALVFVSLFGSQPVEFFILVYFFIHSTATLWLSVKKKEERVELNSASPLEAPRIKVQLLDFVLCIENFETLPHTQFLLKFLSAESNCLASFVQRHLHCFALAPNHWLDLGVCVSFSFSPYSPRSSCRRELLVYDAVWLHQHPLVLFKCLRFFHLLSENWLLTSHSTHTLNF